MPSKNPNGIIILGSWYEAIKELSKEQKGELLDGIFQYNLTGSLPEMSPVSKMAFQFMKSAFDQNNEKYRSICDRNRQNGSKGGRPKKPKKPSGLFGNPKNHKLNNNNKSNDKVRSINIPFDDFWDLYDKKVGDKEKLQKKWESLSDQDRIDVIKYLPLYKESQPDKQYRKNPSTFLNNESWNDEIISKHSNQNLQNSSKLKPVSELFNEENDG